jgi:tetratricopeptide (TPR) repeat protein
LALAAVAGNDALAEAHLAVAGVKNLYDWDWPGAEVEYRRSIELDPNLAEARRAYATYLAAMGRSSEARLQVRRALELDPLSPMVNMEAAWGSYLARDFDEAIRQSWQTLAIEPRYAPAQHTLGVAYEQTGLFDEAIIELGNSLVCSNQHPAAIGALGHAYASAARVDEAWRALDELQEISQRRHVSWYWRSLVYAGLRESARALDCLEAAYRERDVWLIWIRREPRFDALRPEPRFKALVARMRLPH